MRGLGSKYDYDLLEYKPDVDKKAETYFIATPCRAVLHAEAIVSQTPSGIVSKPASSLFKKALRRG